MISNLKTLPVASGQEANQSNSSQSQGNTGGEKDKSAFGDILHGQESRANSSQSDHHQSTQAKESGNKYRDNGNSDHNNSGKELPSDAEVDDTSSPASSDSTTAKAVSDTESTETQRETATNSSSTVAVTDGSETDSSLDNQIDFLELLTTSDQKIGDSSQPISRLENTATPVVTGDPIVSATEGAIIEASINKKIGAATAAEQLLNSKIKQSEINLSAQKAAVINVADDGLSATKSIAESDFLASLTSPVVVTTPSGTTSGVTNNVATGNLTQANLTQTNVTKIDTNIFQSGALTPDDFAEIQQALGGGVAKEKAMFDSMENLIKLDSLGTKPTASNQTPSSAPVSSISTLVNTSAPQLLDPGVAAALKSGALTASVGEPGWDSEFVGRINMLVKGGVHEAKIQLSPPEMGRLEIKVSTEGDSAKIVFGVESVAAREAIEQSMPRLREMLEQGGLQLSHSEVADHSQSQKGKEQVDEDILNQGLSSDSDEEGDDANTWQLGISPSNSTVDYYI